MVFQVSPLVFTTMRGHNESSSIQIEASSGSVKLIFVPILGIIDGVGTSNLSCNPFDTIIFKSTSAPRNDTLVNIPDNVPYSDNCAPRGRTSIRGCLMCLGGG